MVLCSVHWKVERWTERKYVGKSDTTSQYFAHTQCTHSTCMSHLWTSWLFICFMLRLKSSNRLSVQRLVQLFDIWFRHLLTDRVMTPGFGLRLDPDLFRYHDFCGRPDRYAGLKDLGLFLCQQIHVEISEILKLYRSVCSHSRIG